MGARMHYAVPRMLHSAGMLDHLFTDICSVKGWPKLFSFLPESFKNEGVRRLLGRTPNEIPGQKITAFNSFGLGSARRRRQAKTIGESNKIALLDSARFCRLITAHGFGSATGIFAYNRAGLELFQHAKEQGLSIAMEQTIAPKLIESQLIRQERERYPDWETDILDNHYAQELAAREAAEWKLADVILCGSQFVKDGIANCGGIPERCVVVPYGVDASFRVPQRSAHNGPLRVLTIGAIGLRKGTPCIFEAARQLGGSAVFRLIGRTTLSPKKIHELSKFLQILGPIPRSEILQHFAWADVFLLPSICEGSATVTYESLSCGLPTIVTPNAGSVVRDGIDGFVVPIHDSEAVAERLQRLISDENLRIQMSEAAKSRVIDIGLHAYTDRFIAALP